MTDIGDVISFSDAAEEKECSRTTLYRAADDGRINDVKVGGRRMIVEDEKWESFQPKHVGRRAQRNSDDESNTSS